MYDNIGPFRIDKVDEIPSDVMTTPYRSRWDWLRKLVADMGVGEVLRVTCPSKREAFLALASLQNETSTYKPLSNLICRKAPVGRDPSQSWYLYIQKVASG